MNLAEHAGMLLPREAGPVVVEAQVPAGKRGKAGGARPAATPVEVAGATCAVLGTTIGGDAVGAVLVEQGGHRARALRRDRERRG